MRTLGSAAFLLRLDDRWRRTDNATHAAGQHPSSQVLTSMPANAATITHW